GPKTHIKYNQNYTSSNFQPAQSPLFNIPDNAAHITIPPFLNGGNAIAFNLCIDVSNYCYNFPDAKFVNPHSPYFNISVWINGVQVASQYYSETPGNGTLCINLGDLPNGYNQTDAIDIYIIPNS